jgi:hypothetical protein
LILVPFVSISPSNLFEPHSMIDLTVAGCDPRTFVVTGRRWHVTTLRRLFPSLAAAAAVLMFLGITAPAAHAQQRLITYFNFNDSNEVSDFPGEQTSTITQNNLTPSFVAGTTLNRVAPDPAGMALRLTFDNNGGGNPKTFQFTVNTLGLTNLSLSYATQSSVAVTQTLSYSTNGGTTFTSAGIVSMGNMVAPSMSPAPFTKVTFTLPTGADNQASVIFRITISSAATNHRETNDFDNIQLTGVPEPATVVGGLLGALGLCWHQRRRLLGIAQRLRLFRKPAAV